MENLIKNNHNSMKTVVETFLTEETVELIYDNERLDKWNESVKELGLVGQTQIIKKDKSPIPFMHLKSSYAAICETLCPRKVSIESYNITPIPVEILDLLMLSKRENYFKKIEVWYDEKSPDPFVIGINYGTYYSQNNNSLEKAFNSFEEALEHQKENGWDKKQPYPTNPIYYLIGKWADVKHSWAELKEMAVKRYMESEELSCLTQIKDYQRRLEDLKTNARLRFS